MSSELALRDVLAAWHRENGQHPPMAVWCEHRNPLEPAVRCRRFDGHTGSHSSDGADAWRDELAAVPAPELRRAGFASSTPTERNTR